MLLRAPVLDDAAAVFAVLAARDTADRGAPDYVLQDLYDEWRSSEVDLRLDAQVVQDGEEIVGYAIVRRPGTLAVVAPRHEGRGIGARLLRFAEAREREKGKPRHRQWIAASNARGEALLRGAGYRRARSYSRMVCALGAATGIPEPPAGIKLRALDVEADGAPLHALDQVCFAGVADYEPEPLAAFRDEHLQGHDLAPELSRIAERRGTIVAFLLARRWIDERAGYVDLLAVHPDERGQGLGSCLLQSAFAAFAAAGLHEAQLGVASDNPRALSVYERAGMRERFRVDTYERPIRDG